MTLRAALYGAVAVMIVVAAAWLYRAGGEARDAARTIDDLTKYKKGAQDAQDAGDIVPDHDDALRDWLRGIAAE